ncbi:hypothetical protein BX666DRAFT_617877 [Dichotomocladium elegans]|nr:hypothetical protein BX666DRAFT_617877 [Dichotomocladium elegans]
MPAENPLVHCLDRLNLGDDQRLLQRAEYYQGLCSSRIPVKVFDKGPNCKAVVAIQLAAESLLLGNDWDTKLAAQLAGCTKRGYESTLSNVRKSLNLQPNVSLDTLGVAFGCTTMVPLVKTLWEEFAPAYLARLRGAQRQIAKEELEQQPAWKGAVFYACAKALGVSMSEANASDYVGCFCVS